MAEVGQGSFIRDGILSEASKLAPGGDLVQAYFHRISSPTAAGRRCITSGQWIGTATLPGLGLTGPMTALSCSQGMVCSISARKTSQQVPFFLTASSRLVEVTCCRIAASWVSLRWGYFTGRPGLVQTIPKCPVPDDC